MDQFQCYYYCVYAEFDGGEDDNGDNNKVKVILRVVRISEL